MMMMSTKTGTATRRLFDLLLLVWLWFCSIVIFVEAGGPPPPPPPGANTRVIQQRTTTSRDVPPPPLKLQQVQRGNVAPARPKLPPPPPKMSQADEQNKQSILPENKKVSSPPPSIAAKDALLDRFANKHSTNSKPPDTVVKDPLLERFNRIVGDTKETDVKPDDSVETKEALSIKEEQPKNESLKETKKDKIDHDDDEEEEMLLLGEAASVPPPLKRMENLYPSPHTPLQLIAEDTKVAAASAVPPGRPPSQQSVLVTGPIPQNQRAHGTKEPVRRSDNVMPSKVIAPPNKHPPQQQYHRPPQQQQFQQQPPQQQQQKNPSQRQQQPQQQQQQQYRPPQNYQQQQWAQQQQQQRQQQQAPPPNRRQQQRSKAATSSTPFLLKSLWQRVEKSLDSLVNVEDFVADRANQLTNQVTHRARSLLGTTMLSQSQEPDHPDHPPVATNNRRAPTVQQRQGPQQRPNQQQQQAGGKFGATKPLQPVSNNKGATMQGSASGQKLPASVASLYSGSFVTPEGDDSDDDEDAGEQPGRRNSPWQNVPIRAGSSNPESATRTAGSTGASGLYGRKDSPFMQLQQEHRQGGNNNPNPPTNAMSTNENSRAAASAPSTVQRPFAAARSGSQQPRQEITVRPSISYDDVPEKSPWTSRIGGMLPSLPRMPSIVSKLLGHGSGSHRNLAAATLDVWKEDEQTAKRFSAKRLKQTARAAAAGGRKGPDFSSATPPLTDLLSRCHNGKSTSLLSIQELRHCRSIANTRAILDLGVLGLVVLGAQQILTVSESINFKSIDGAVATLISNLATASHGWGYFALVTAFLTATTNFVLFQGQINGMATSISNTVRGASQYAQLYMRLVAGQSVDKHVPERMQQAARVQTLDRIQTIRMQTFVTIVLATMLLMTVSVVQPILLSVLAGFYHSLTLPELWSWPVPWSKLGSALMEISHSVVAVIKDLLFEQFSTFMEHPLTLAFQLSIVAALLIAAFLPTLEHHRKVRPLDVNEEEDEDVTASAFGTVTTLSNLGVSSASRLGLLSKSGALEGTLERWRATLPPLSALHDARSFSSWLRCVGYKAGSTLALASPIFVYFHCFNGICLNRQATSALAGFDSIWNVSIMLLFVLRSSWKSITSTIESSNLRPYIQFFVKGLGEVVDEVSSSKQEGIQNQLGSSISPTIGLCIKDLWAAHASKRAWAVRGASFDCHNGEVVAILGDDGAGKSRMLTAISEVLVNPSKRSLTTTKVRGSVSVGGLDAAKWDRDQLKKRLGIFLNDVRTIADNAEFMSGFTLEEILEPMDGLLNKNPTAGARAVSQALQISGLSATLLPRLPGKLSTVVTANENELTPSELRPRCYALSPSEWSKLLLSRVLAQTIFDNENVSNSPLVGSLLLLDDLTTHMSEEEELRIMQTLRKTGAATVFTSHKWASGRLADRIVVLRDGAVVESGTHNELLARGPQQSMYAAKWNTMTTG